MRSPTNSETLRPPAAKMKHGPITDAVPDSWIRGIRNRLHFLGSEVPDKPYVCFLRGDGQNALDLLQRRRHAIFHGMHEGFDGGEFRKFTISGALNCSSCSCEGGSLTRSLAYSSRS